MRFPFARPSRLPHPGRIPPAADFVVRNARRHGHLVTLNGIAGASVLAAALLVPSVATARPTAASSPSIAVTPSTLAAGTTLAVHGEGFDRRQRGTVVVDGEPSSGIAFTVRGNGSFDLDLTVPADTPAGTHAIVADGPDGVALARTTVDVVDATLSASAGPFVSPLLTAPPSLAPSPLVTLSPTAGPAASPTLAPTLSPTLTPTLAPTVAPTQAPTAPPTAAPTTAPVTYTFDEEFNGTGLGSIWGTSSHWTNLSEAVADRGQLSVANGVLTISAVRTSTGWKSGELDTWGRWSQRYGYFEARMRFSEGTGMWPAFWLAHDWTGDRSELDINETLANPYPGSCGDNAGAYYATVHLSDGSTPQGSHRFCPGYDLANQWHTYGMDWRPDHITFYFDGKAWYTYTGTIPSVSMPVILNLAMGGWAGSTSSSTPSPSTMQVDWVRARP